MLLCVINGIFIFFCNISLVHVYNNNRYIYMYTYGRIRMWPQTALILFRHKAHHRATDAYIFFVSLFCAPSACLIYKYVWYILKTKSMHTHVVINPFLHAFALFFYDYCHVCLGVKKSFALLIIFPLLLRAPNNKQRIHLIYPLLGRKILLLKKRRVIRIINSKKRFRKL